MTSLVRLVFGATFGKHIEEFLLSPLPNWLIVAGYVTGGVMRGLIVGAVVTIVSVLFAHLQVHHLFMIIAAVLLTSIVFSLGGLINAVLAKNFDQVNWVPAFVVTPLAYFGGVFYTVSMLPEWAQKVSYANPILYMVNAFRHGFFGRSDVDVGLAFTIMIASALVLFGAALTMLNKGMGIRE